MSFTLCHVAGIRVRVHATTLLLFLLPLVTGTEGGFATAFVLISLLFIALICHEFGHALTARKIGLQVTQIVFLPIGGYTLALIPPGDWKSEMRVVAAGPIVNLVIAGIVSIFVWDDIARGDAFSFFQTRTETLIAPNPLLFFFQVNVLIGALNLIPAFPLDGGRLLRAFLTPALGFVRSTRVTVFVARVVGFLVLALSTTAYDMTKVILAMALAIFCWRFAMLEEKRVRLLEAHRVALSGLDPPEASDRHEPDDPDRPSHPDPRPEQDTIPS